MKAIVCVDKKWGIGKNGGMLFHLPEDLKFFKEKTLNHTVVMGHNTFLSLPNGALPQRRNIVLSKKDNLALEGAEVLKSTAELFKILENTDDVFLIGGEQLYKELLPYCDTAYVTKVLKDGEAQKFFPDLDKNSDWQLIKAGEKQKSGNLEYFFTTYKRIK